MENKITIAEWYDLDKTIAVSKYVELYINEEAHRKYMIDFLDIWLKHFGIKRDNYNYIPTEGEVTKYGDPIFEIVRLDNEKGTIKARYKSDIDLQSTYISNVETATLKKLYYKSIETFKELKENFLGN